MEFCVPSTATPPTSTSFPYYIVTGAIVVRITFCTSIMNTKEKWWKGGVSPLHCCYRTPILNIQNLELPKLDSNGRTIIIFVVTIVQLCNEHHQGVGKSPSPYPPSHPNFIFAISIEWQLMKFLSIGDGFGGCDIVATIASWHVFLECLWC
jgi:hypothetical protein